MAKTEMGFGGRARRCGLLASAAAAALVGPAVRAAHAQENLLVSQYLNANVPGLATEPGVTVLSRQRPEYDPLGIRLGEVTIRPELDETLGFDDNVVGTASHRGSAVVETNARVQALYDHSDTSAFLTASVDDNRFLQQSSQNYTNWSISLGGSHQFGRDVLSANYSHLNLNETPRDLDVPNLNIALPYQVDTGTVSYRVQLAKSYITPQLTVSHYDYSNGVANGQTYLQTYRNRTILQPSVVFGYQLAPQRDLVVVVREATSDYDQKLAGFPGRNYNDYSVLGGLDFANGGPWRYRLLAGYEARTFTDSAYRTIQAPIVEAEVFWSPTGLTTVTANAFRRIQDSAAEATAATTESQVGLRVDHELRRNILLQANGAYYREDYSQGGGNQQLFSAGTGFTWLINRNMQLVGTYDFVRRTASSTLNLGLVNNQPLAQNYSENRVLFTVRFAL